MIVPDLKGAAKGLLDPRNFTETLTSTLDIPSILFSGHTGVLGRKSRHAAVLNDKGPKRSKPTGTTAVEIARTPSETLQVETARSDIVPRVTTAPNTVPSTADFDKRQVQTTRSSTVSCPGGLSYIVCSDGSFSGCGSGNICNITSRSTSSTATTTSATGRLTGTATASQTSSIDSATTSTSTLTSTSTAATSAKTPVGAIAGGAVGGAAALVIALFLLAFFVRRHRKKIERRRLADANPFLPKHSSPPPPMYQDRPGGHHRSGSTSNDIYGTMGGSSSRTNFQQAEKGRLINMSSLQANPAPGLRADGGPGLPPAAFLRPAQMLDGRPINEIGGYERPRSVKSVAGSKFAEHIAVEMEDTSSSRAASPGKSVKRPPSPISQDSPILGRTSAFSNSTATSSLASDVTRRQHLMSWSTYASDGDGEEMSATLNSSKAPPSARSTPSQISEQSGGQLLSDSTYVVSPLRKDKFERGRSS